MRQGGPPRPGTRVGCLSGQEPSSLPLPVRNQGGKRQAELRSSGWRRNVLSPIYVPPNRPNTDRWKEFQDSFSAEKWAGEWRSLPHVSHSMSHESCADRLLS